MDYKAAHWAWAQIETDNVGWTGVLKVLGVQTGHSRRTHHGNVNMVKPATFAGCYELDEPGDLLSWQAQAALGRR